MLKSSDFFHYNPFYFYFTLQIIFFLLNSHLSQIHFFIFIYVFLSKPPTYFSFHLLSVPSVTYIHINSLTIHYNLCSLFVNNTALSAHRHVGTFHSLVYLMFHLHLLPSISTHSFTTPSANAY